MSAAPPNARSEQSPHLKVDDLLDGARRTSGLTDFGDPWFVHPLTHLVDLINDEAAIVSTVVPGAEVIRGYLVDRLRRVEFVKQNPAVLDEVVRVAGVIIGMPRGGSTLLQRLLCSSPQITAARTWELMSPFPQRDDAPGDPTPRIKQAQALIDAMANEWPGSTQIHPLQATSYDEESFFISRSFLSVDYIFYFHMPSWVRWHLTQDQSRAYDELRLWFQILQYQDPSRRKQKWILKTGHHLWCGGLRYLLRTFPEAKMLMTHRGLERVIPSMCSLQASLLGMHTRNFDPKVLGREAIQLYHDALMHLREVRAEQPADRFIDFQYQDLVRDPVGEFRRGNADMGLVVDAAAEAAAVQWIQTSRKEAQLHHRYSAEDFGLTTREIIEAFRFYTEEYLC
jgi:hypothetical protein